MTRLKICSTLLILPVILLVIIMSGFGTRKSFIDELKARLNQYNLDFHNEKAYLATDRFVYRPGEDLWFQGFVTSVPFGQHDRLSEDLFIKLLNSKGDEIISRRYPLNDNRATGRLLIPRTTIPGKYYLVGYTGWMKNQPPQEAFRKELLISKYFEKRFHVEILYDEISYFPDDSMKASIRLIDPIGKPMAGTSFDYTIGSIGKTYIKGTGKSDEKGYSVIKSIIPTGDEILLLSFEIRSRKISGEYTLIIPATISTPVITFFPEGGNLVKGIKNTMAFRSNNKYAQPASIEGEIIDHKSGFICKIKTNKHGLGLFEYMPTADTCHLRITRPLGITKLFPLPVAQENGLVIHLRETRSDSAIMEIKGAEDIGTCETYWVAVMNRQIVWSSMVSFQKSSVVRIPLDGLKQGILQLNVFDNKQNQIAERLIKIPDRKNGFSVKPDRNIYHNRQRVTLTLDYVGSSKTVDVALSVSLQQLAYNPFMSDFKSVINSFAYDSLPAISLVADKSTDLELLTTNYHIINWSEVFSNLGIIPGYVRQDGLTGKVYDKKENLSQHAKVHVIHIPTYRSYETQTDENGNFKVHFGSEIIDFSYLNIDAYDALGKINLTSSVTNDYSVQLRNNLVMDEEMNNQQKIIDAIAYGDPEMIYLLRYGPGRFRKSNAETKKKYDPKHYTHYTNVLDIISDIRPYMLQDNTIVFNETDMDNESAFAHREAIIVINGALKGNNVEILKRILPSDITNINISTSLLDVHQYTPVNFRGVIEITTIQGMYRYRQPAIQLGTDILNTNRVFYSPDYSIENPSSVDNRKTLYWNPLIAVNSGQSALITFYTSDNKGIFLGRAEGIDKEGNPVSAEFTFVVE
jgi:hypothetical protein